MDLKTKATAFLRGWSDGFSIHPRPLGPIEFPRILTNDEAICQDFAAVGLDITAAAQSLAKELKGDGQKTT
ncbi:MAG: hypothetical protein ACRC1K_17315 [Planctomycetia bacterium]